MFLDTSLLLPLEDFVGPLVPEGGEIMLGLSDALSCMGDVLTTVTGNGTLAALAFGFVAIRGGARALKRVIRIGG